ncbi:histidine phosphatase family protein [Sphingomonas sp. PR090111-T3T-6A]|uniref:histidine phosphatase family protein n=1 Tax=Sphingomonas sp. PR090111-T3T-6A TaxID=685778 RepID=UPI00037014D9|nr:histidine phosphatase family protein [Sphingomonas sp. PR090111-T3T-6A]
MTPRLLHLMRHGEPEGAGRLLGRTDVAATAAGIASCADQVEGLEVGAVVSSNLQRARACAGAAEAVLGQPVSVDPRWRELDFGEWDGLAPTMIDADALGRFWSDPDTNPPPGGERWSTLVARVDEALAALPEGPVLVITHGGAMRAALALLCGMDQRATWVIDLPYAALLTLRVWPSDPPSAQIVALRP